MDACLQFYPQQKNMPYACKCPSTKAIQLKIIPGIPVLTGR